MYKTKPVLEYVPHWLAGDLSQARQTEWKGRKQPSCYCIVLGNYVSSDRHPVVRICSILVERDWWFKSQLSVTALLAGCHSQVLEMAIYQLFYRSSTSSSLLRLRHLCRRWVVVRSIPV